MQHQLSHQLHRTLQYMLEHIVLEEWYNYLKVTLSKPGLPAEDVVDGLYAALLEDVGVCL